MTTFTNSTIADKFKRAKKEKKVKSRLDDDDDTETSEQQQATVVEAPPTDSNTTTTTTDDITIQPITEAELSQAKKQDEQVAQFMKQQAEAEKQRLEKNGAKVGVIAILNCGLVKRQEKNKQTLVNRVEANSSYNFNNIYQLMVSDPVAVPCKANYQYVNVILLSKASQVAQLVPYVFPKDKTNSLQHWLFINNQLQRFVHILSSCDTCVIEPTFR